METLPKGSENAEPSAQIADGTQAMGHAPRTSKDVPNFDALRSVAVSCVLIRHLVAEFGDHPNAIFQPQALGIFGVLLFFVHTSFVLMGSLERQASAGPGTPIFWPFIIRRVFRIYPAVIAVILLEWFVLPGQGSHVAEMAAVGQKTLPVLFGNLALVQNLFNVPFVNGSLWTLPLEMQMYLVLPALFLVASLKDSTYLWITWACALCVAIAVVMMKHPGPLNMLAYSPCFIAGAFCYRQFKRDANWPSWVLGLILFGSVFVYMMLYAKFPHETILGWFVCLGVGFALPRIRDIQNEVLKTVSRAIAVYSYGVYLWHPFCIWAAFRGMGISSLPLKFLAFAVMLVIAVVISYHFVELPLMRLGAKLTTPKKKTVAAPAS
jgi:peptidoglycan/LPS O-acetylase OafA/YrhL